MWSAISVVNFWRCKRIKKESVFNLPLSLSSFCQSFSPSKLFLPLHKLSGFSYSHSSGRFYRGKKGRGFQLLVFTSLRYNEAGRDWRKYRRPQTWLVLTQKEANANEMWILGGVKQDEALEGWQLPEDGSPIDLDCGLQWLKECN